MLGTSVVCTSAWDVWAVRMLGTSVVYPCLGRLWCTHAWDVCCVPRLGTSVVYPCLGRLGCTHGAASQGVYHNRRPRGLQRFFGLEPELEKSLPLRRWGCTGIFPRSNKSVSK